YLAGALGRRHYRRNVLATRQDGLGLEHTIPPAVVEITGGAAQEGPRIAKIIEASSSRVITLRAPVRPASNLSTRFEHPAATAAAAKTMTTVSEAADYLKAYAARARSARAEEYRGSIVPGGLPRGNAVWAVLDPRESKENAALLGAGRKLADLFGLGLNAVVPSPKNLWPQLAGLAQAIGANRVFCLDTRSGMLSVEGRRELSRIVANTADRPVILGGAHWMDAFGFVAGELAAKREHVRIFGNVEAIAPQGADALLSIPAYEGRLIRKERLAAQGTAFLTIAQDAGAGEAERQKDFAAFELEYPLSEAWIMPLPPEAGPTLTRADVIIVLGYGIRDRAGLELAQELGKRLETLGLAPLFGATRKVTQDLKLLPLEAQIGQTGVRVNPGLILALGVSGAPQHIDYVGTRAEILCFNKDPDAPLMRLNQTRPAPRVHPLAGDLFTMVKELIEKLS
ncbi:MAG: FAD-binding protein, partial [Nitrospirota bacterium]